MADALLFMASGIDGWVSMISSEVIGAPAVLVLIDELRVVVSLRVMFRESLVAVAAVGSG